MYKVVFVCTGNICRSSTAEAVLRHLIDQENLHDEIACASRGLISYHVGEAPDPRSCATAKAKGYVMDDQRASQFEQADFDAFDLILAMDRGHFSKLMNSAENEEQKKKIRMFGEFLSQNTGSDIPDPYYGEQRGFDQVLKMVEDGVQGILVRYRSLS